MSPLHSFVPWRITPGSTMTDSERISPQDDDDDDDDDDDANELSWRNLVNFLLFLGSTFVVVGIGFFGLFGLQTIREVSDIYPTLMTPVYWVAPVVWTLLLASLAVWAVAQLLPKYRNCPLQVQGVRYYYAGVALSQIVWIMTFSYQLVILSLFAAVSIMVFLLLIRHSQEKLECHSWQDFLIHKLPFSFYMGWNIPVVLWNVDVVLVHMSVNPETQFFVAIISIAESIVGMGILSSCFTLDVIPLVISFYTIGIWIELYDPSPKISMQFTDGQILAIQITAVAVVSVILLTTLVRVGLYCTKSSRQRHDDDDDKTVLSANSWDDDDEESQRHST